MRRGLILGLAILTAPLWLAALVVVALARMGQPTVLYAVAWIWWIGRARRRVLFVYSDSPHWREHVEANILPKLPENSVVLNWSHRSSWNRFNVSVMLFRCFAGAQEFNPIGLVFERFSVVTRYRFWQAFRDARHGRAETLQAVERRFLEHAAAP